MFAVRIGVGEVHIEITTDNAYPDIADDLTSRAQQLVNHTLMQLKLNNWQPFDLEVCDCDPDEDETPGITPDDNTL